MFDGTFNAGSGTVKLTDANHTITGGNGSTVTFNNLIMEPLTAPRTITIGRSIQPMVLAVNGDFISGSSAASQVSFVKANAGSNVTNPVTSYYCASNGGIANITCLPGGPPSPGYGSTPAPGSTLSMTTTQGTNGTSTLTVSETGNAALNITGITVTGTDAAKFTPSPTSFSIADGGADQDVTVTCDASSVGTFTNATLNVAHNATGSPATYPLSCTVNPAAPTVSSVSSTTANGSYKAGDPVSVTITFSESVTVTGTPQLTLNPGTPYAVNYSGGSGTDTLTFDYTVVAGHTSTDLDYIVTSPLVLNSGTIKDTATVTKDAILTLPSPGAAGSLGANKAIVIDTTAPTVALSSAASNPTNLSPFSVTATFSESVTGFAVGDITVGNGSAGNFSGSGATYTFDITPTSNGAVTVDIAAGAAADSAGNNSTVATQLSRTYDGTAPTVSLTSGAANPTNTSPISVTATFSESVTGFDSGDVGVSNGSVSNFAGSGASYTFDVTPLSEGAVTVNIPANVAQDSAGNNSTAAAQLSRTYDTTAPTVALSTAAPNPTNASPFSVTATFSESVTGFALGDISVTNGSAGNFSGSGATYTFDVTPAADGSVSVNIPANAAQDGAGNNNTAATALSRTYDGTVPTVALSTAASEPTNASPFSVTATFSESVTGFAVGDISVTNGSAGNFSGSGATYTFDVTPAADGSVIVNIPANAAQDSAGSNNTAATALSRTYDGTAPTVALSGTASEPTNASPFSVTATFSESVTGFAVGDISVTNGSAGNFSGSGTTYTFDVTPSADGAVSVNIPANGAQDSAGNNNNAATALSRTYDGTAPTVTLEKAVGQADPTSTVPIYFTVTFSETVSGFDTADLDFTGTTAPGTLTANISGTGSSYTVEISGMTDDGDVAVSVKANAAQDAAGNDSAASTGTDNTVYYDLIDLVINETDYDQGATDTLEFIEIKNIGASGINLGDYTLEFIDDNGGSPSVYRTVTLDSVTLAAGDYFVICDTLTSLPNCDQATGFGDDFIQDGSPDAIVLKKEALTVDKVSYGGDVPGYTETSGAAADSTTEPFVSLSRYPDGTDTNNNSTDFSLRCATPGRANSISDSGNCYEFTVDDVTVDEGDTGTVTATFTVGLSHNSPGGITVDYATTDDTATLTDGDYTAASGTLTFGSGENSKTVDVTVNGDSRDEINETFFLNLSPVFVSSPVTSVTAGYNYTCNIAADDPDEWDSLTFTAENLPAWLTLTDNGDGTALLTGRPPYAGSHEVSLSVTDRNGESDTQVFTVTVMPVPYNPPYIPPVVTEPETPDVTEPETPDVTEPETPDVTEPETPDVTEPETPDVTEPETPDVTEPETPDVTDPETPDVTDPEVPDSGIPAAPEDYPVSYTYRDEGYTVEEGFLLHVITEKTEGFSLGISGGNIPADTVWGEGAADNPFVFHWTPEKDATAVLADSPFPGDTAYTADFLLRSGGNTMPYSHPVPYTVYASEEHNTADNPEDQKVFESLYGADHPVITVFETVFSPARPADFDFIVYSPTGEFIPLNVEIPVIPYENIFIDTSSENDGGNLHYDKETDRFSIDTQNPDFIPFAEDGKLRVKIISYNFGDRAVSTGLTLEFSVSGGEYNGFPVRINPVLSPDGNRDGTAPLITITMLLNPEAGNSLS